MNKKLLWTVLTVMVVLAVALLVMPIFWHPASAPGPQTCTLEAKICSDGSAVGRTAPNCEFASCPETSTPPVIDPSWATFTDSSLGVSFRYPSKLSAKYISLAEWPPKVSISNEQFSCSTTAPESSLPTRVAKQTIGGHLYCINATSEGAAGSVYTSYSYTTEKDGKSIVLGFTLQYPQCVNYDDPQKTECQNERQVFNLDKLVDQIIGSIVFTK